MFPAGLCRTAHLFGLAHPQAGIILPREKARADRASPAYWNGRPHQLGVRKFRSRALFLMPIFSAENDQKSRFRAFFAQASHLHSFRASAKSLRDFRKPIEKIVE
jgi:hypothetical protein